MPGAASAVEKRSSSGSAVVPRCEVLVRVVPRSLSASLLPESSNSGNQS